MRQQVAAEAAVKIVTAVKRSLSQMSRMRLLVSCSSRSFSCVVLLTCVITTDLSPVHTSNNVEATLSNATSQMIFSTRSNVASTLSPYGSNVELLRHCCRFWQQCWTFHSNNVEQNFVLLTKSQQLKHVQFVSMFNLFWLCRKDEILRQTSSTLLPFLATKSNVVSTKSKVASTLLLVWTGLCVFCHWFLC